MAKIKFTAGRVAEFQCGADGGRAFLWDSAAPGLGLCVTATGAKSYIFQGKLKRQVIRIKIGTPSTWSIPLAQAEARRLKIMIDSGQDPRQVKAKGLRAEQDERDREREEDAAAQARQLRESVTLGAVWPVYVAERSPLWSAVHIASHSKLIHAGGEARKRSKKETKAGPLAAFADVRLAELSAERVEAWARLEAATRPSGARLALRLLKAFLNWCAGHPLYSQIVNGNAAKSSKARESLGKPKVKHDLLQREQLAAWFGAVQKISNPVIAAYLQTLLLVGARREELAALRWVDVDFQWCSMKLGDKIEDFRMVPLTPYVAHLLANLPRRNEWVFSSPAAAAGYIAEPRHAHNEAVAIAGLPHLTLHGLRRSFATLCEWTETPSGIAAQIQGHAPQGVREQNYIRRPLDLLRKWHIKIESWMLEQAGIEFMPEAPGLRVVSANS
ncbi:tyrosine-type recombinase/integrase [Massilia sp. PWRC2]|uniref:tyrosine-type recombinase/integrase n=1 Tax=Massilia sp. PWRC2 TaxID=2804626 RepID=UPI003CED5C96